MISEGVGDVLNAQGNATDALRMYGNAISIRKNLSARDDKWQTDIALDEEEIGDAMIAAKDYTGAVEHCLRAIALDEAVAARDFRGIDVHINLAKSFEKLGEALGGQGKQAESLQNLKAALDICDSLLRVHPKIARTPFTLLPRSCPSWKAMNDPSRANPSA